jgi:hypothetical protein
MTRRLTLTTIVAVAAVSLAAGAASAQDREGQARRRESGRAVQQGHAQRREASAPAAPRASEGRRQESARAASRDSERRTYTMPRATMPGNDSRSYSAPQAEARGNRSARPQAGRDAPREYSGGRVEPQAKPRPYDQQPSPGYRPDSGGGHPPYGGGRARYETARYVRPPHFQSYRPLYFSRPYYGFRPHVHIGFGVWLGVSVPYPWAYVGSYRPRVYGYYSRQYYGVAPGMYQYGGLSFDIQPSDADLWVDGEYVGPVGTFTPYGEPLTLWPGVHHIAIVREGFRTMEWEVTVEPGRVIPYRGMLARW